MLLTGKTHGDNIYCKVSLGDQEQETDVAKETVINGNTNQTVPQVPVLVWNHSMQFPVRSLGEDVLTLVVYEMCPFTTDGKFLC